MKRHKKDIKTPDTGVDSSPLQPLPEPNDISLWQEPFVHFLLILATGFIVYFNSINVPFMFDDNEYLVKNPVIKSFDCFPHTQKVFEYAVNQDLKNNLVLRPIAYFSFAVNYALHGLDLFGYHLVSLLLHIGCGMLLYVFFVQLIESPKMTNSKDCGKASGVENVGYLPLFAALLFICHPLQTQAVTYVIQRFVPLATFFYLATLVFYLQFRCATTTSSRVISYTLSFITAILAMESKEIAFTLPVIIALVEFMFYRSKLIPSIVRLVPFMLTMAIIPVKLMHLSSPVNPQKMTGVTNGINLVNFGGISPWDYLMTQFGVITTYIRLLFLPIKQNLDYDYPLQQDFFNLEVLLPLTLLLLIVGMGLFLLKHSKVNRLYKIIAFGIFWFFITLSIESSIVPIEDLIFEHRTYLPSVGFFVSFLAGLSVLFNRFTGTSIGQSKFVTYLLILLVIGLSIAAIKRNRIWQNETVFWNDVVTKSPNKARAYKNLGSALMNQSIYVPNDIDKNLLENMVILKAGSEKQILDAISAFKKAIRIEPNKPDAHQLLAKTLILQKNFDEALRSLKTASELQPTNPIPYVMRGEIYESKNDIAQAYLEYSKAVKIGPLNHEARIKLANIYAKKGNFQNAIQEFELVMQIFPDESTRKRLDQLKKM